MTNNVTPCYNDARNYVKIPLADKAVLVVDIPSILANAAMHVKLVSYCNVIDVHTSNFGISPAYWILCNNSSILNNKPPIQN